MPKDMEYWRQLIESTLQDVTDEAFQRRVWFGAGPEISSPGEVINGLTGDADLEEYLEDPENGLSNSAREEGYVLIDQIDRFCASMPRFMKPEVVIDDPRWSEIRATAARFLDQFRKDLGRGVAPIS